MSKSTPTAQSFIEHPDYAIAAAFVLGATGIASLRVLYKLCFVTGKWDCFVNVGRTESNETGGIDAVEKVEGRTNNAVIRVLERGIATTILLYSLCGFLTLISYAPGYDTGQSLLHPHSDDFLRNSPSSVRFHRWLADDRCSFDQGAVLLYDRAGGSWWEVGIMVDLWSAVRAIRYVLSAHCDLELNLSRSSDRSDLLELRNPPSPPLAIRLDIPLFSNQHSTPRDILHDDRYNPHRLPRDSTTRYRRNSKNGTNKGNASIDLAESVVREDRVVHAICHHWMCSDTSGAESRCAVRSLFEREEGS